MTLEPVRLLPQLQAIGERLGVPAFVLVVLLVTLIPKIDRGIQIADRVDGQLGQIAASCDLRPRGQPQ